LTADERLEVLYRIADRYHTAEVRLFSAEILARREAASTDTSS